VQREFHKAVLAGLMLAISSIAVTPVKVLAADAGGMILGATGSETPSTSAFDIPQAPALPSSPNATLGSSFPTMDVVSQVDTTAPVETSPSSEPAEQWNRFPDNQWWINSPTTIQLPGVNGHVGVKRGTFTKNVPVDLTLSQLSKALQYNVGLNLEVGHGRAFVGFQGAWAHWKKDDITGPFGLSNIDVNADFGLLNGYLGYHILDIPFGGPDHKPPTLGIDALLGTDWTFLNLNVEPSRLSSETRNVSWFDPYVGLRGRYKFTQQFNITAQGEVGGVNADHDKFFWMANVLAEYRFTPKFSIYGGYGAISQDFESDTFIYRIIMHGPLVGFNYVF
jgi:hypothetical protein